jgi:hypothetical protein
VVRGVTKQASKQAPLCCYRKRCARYRGYVRRLEGFVGGLI